MYENEPLQIVQFMYARARSQYFWYESLRGPIVRSLARSSPSTAVVSL